MKFIAFLCAICTFSIANASPFQPFSQDAPQVQKQGAEGVTNCVDLSGTWAGTCQSVHSDGQSDFYEDQITIFQMGCGYIDFQYDYFEMGQVSTEMKGSNVYSTTLDWLPSGNEITFAAVHLSANRVGAEFVRSYGSGGGRLYLENGSMKTSGEFTSTTDQSNKKETFTYSSACTYNQI